MGRLGYEPVIQHFSHPHPLEITNLQEALAPATCAACKLGASGWAYACRTCCSHHLHVACAQLPQLISHPADRRHPLALLPVPPYPGGFFHCDACGLPGTGFSYGCSACGLDLHTLCASMPLSVTHHAHPHPLALAFFAPYGNKGFSCDVCAGVGTKHWLYRCAACEFDAHVGCATAAQPEAGASNMAGLRSRSLQGSNDGSAGVPMVSSNDRGGAVRGFVGSAALRVGKALTKSVLDV